MKTKTEFVCIQPKSSKSKDIFECIFNSLHSCKVLQRENKKLYVKSIAGDYYFWMDEKNDDHWEIVK